MGSIGENIKLLRERRGWSQGELGRRIGKTRSAVSQYESGLIVPRMGVVEDLAQVFGVKKSTIIGDTAGSGIRLSFDEQELVECYRSMTPRFRTELLSLARTMADNGMAKNNRVSEEGIA